MLNESLRGMILDYINQQLNRLESIAAATDRVTRLVQTKEVHDIIEDLKYRSLFNPEIRSETTAKIKDLVDIDFESRPIRKPSGLRRFLNRLPMLGTKPPKQEQERERIEEEGKRQPGSQSVRGGNERRGMIEVRELRSNSKRRTRTVRFQDGV